MKRILGIDYGDARTGISITDALNITAQGLETINNKGSSINCSFSPTPSTKAVFS